MRRNVLAKLFGRPVKHVYVHIAANALDTSVRRELPMEQTHIRHVLPVAGYPEFIVPDKIGRIFQMVQKELLRNVQHWAFAALLFDDAKPGTHFAKHVSLAKPLDLPFGRLNVEHWGQVGGEH